MDRRKSLKAIALGSLGAVTLLSGCKDEMEGKNAAAVVTPGDYGRTPEEAMHDAALMKERFFTDAEMATLSVLCDMIIPADEHSGSATDAKVPEFIDFMMKDIPDMQTPMRGGLRWVDMKSFKLFDKSFIKAGKEQQLELVELIAYPERALPADRQGVNFFTSLRNLTASGFFTSKIGIDDLQYKGNTPNNWDGVPEDVLKQYGLAYDEKTLEQCLKNEDRGKIMVWED